MMLACTFVVTSCVGGPSEYFRTVTQETSLQSVPLQTEMEPNSLIAVPVEAAELAAPTQSPQQPPVSDAPASEATASEAIKQQSSEALPVIASNDNQLPAELNPEPAALSSAYAPTESQNIENQIIAGLAPSNADGGLPEGGFAIGVHTPILVDPVEEAAESRIPQIYSQIKHGQCSGGKGPSPKSIGATRINPGDPYYIEIRMRNTPLLPVGHTYVAYGKLRGDGEILDEQLIMLAPFGGYAGAALASGIPIPGVLTPHPDDCRIRPETAYRVSLSAQRYEQLLAEIRQAKIDKPAYLLFAYNCNHFASRIAQSVGIRPPRNIYVPAVEYLYAMIEENEGRKIARR